MATRWGKLNDDGTLVYAGATIRTDAGLVYNPSEATLRANGWKPVYDEPATTMLEAGWHWEPDGWTEDEEGIYRQHRQVEDAPTVRFFSKLKLYEALLRRGLWARFAAMGAGDADAMNAATAIMLANAEDMREDHPLAAPIIAAARANLGLTAEEVEDILAEAEA